MATNEIKVIRKSDARIFLEGDEVCRDYLKTDKITFGTSTLLPGQRGTVDPGHPTSHEVWFCVKGHVLLNVDGTGQFFELFAEDMILMPESAPHQVINIGEEVAVLSWSLAPSEKK